MGEIEKRRHGGREVKTRPIISYYRNNVSNKLVGSVRESPVGVGRQPTRLKNQTEIELFKPKRAELVTPKPNRLIY